MKTPLIALVTGLLFLPAAHAQTDVCADTDPRAIDWLKKMSRSAHASAYHGVVNFQRGDELEVMQVSHLADDSGTTETFTRLTGQGAQVLREQHAAECVHPGQQLLEMGNDLASGECGIARHYRFELGQGERIANRESVRLNVMPRDVYRYGYILQLDRETGLLLQATTMGRGNTRLERFAYADLTYGPAPQPRENVSVVHKAEHPLQDLQALPAVTFGWTVTWLPPGFTATQPVSPNNGQRSFTDGLAVFSVFMEPLDVAMTPGEGVVRWGSTTSYTRGMRAGEVPVLVTIIGEVPVNTARMVTDSIKRAN
ncbi:MAG: MucB/RseB C-terminal domain-containing protein [Halioglobus sp.]